MIIIRNIFRLQFGKAKEAIAIMKESRDMLDNAGFKDTRLLVDVVGDFYTIVLETTAQSLGEWESIAASTLPQEEWQKQYARLTPLVLEGRREIFRVVE
jgi:hypothetical protein